jgi:hypothetical protein
MGTCLVLGLLASAACNGDELDEVLGSPGAPTVLSACDSQGNLVENCGFDEDLTGWRTLSDRMFWTHVADDGVSRLGCLEADAEESGSGSFWAVVQQCIVNPDPTCVGCAPTSDVYDVSAHIRVTAGAPDDCALYLNGYFDSDCRQATGAIALATGFTLSGDWSESAPASTQLPSGTAMAISVRCQDDSPFTIRVDDVLFRAQ